MNSVHIEEPTFLISPMRCGSNFLANVLSKSSSQKYVSIYRPEITPILEFNPYFIIKSHAPSYVHLLSECGAYLPFMNRLPHKMIILVRDPRDMFISLYDWMEARLKKSINQKTFLNDLTYSYSAPGLGELCQCDALKHFIRNWWYANEHSSVKSVFRLKFEDLVSNKKDFFELAKSFLNMQCEIDESFFEEKVQQLSVKREDRGTVGSHKKYSKDYKFLIDSVESQLSEEINKVGYS